MLDLEQMILRLLVAMALGAVIGWEREILDKEAGIRTSLVVSAGAAMFTMAALAMPYLVATSPEHLDEVLARNSGFMAMVGNIVVGIGFLGAGLIIKAEGRVHGLTTAAVVWAVAAIGVFAGLGLLGFAASATLILTASLLLLRKVKAKVNGVLDSKKP